MLLFIALIVSGLDHTIFYGFYDRADSQVPLPFTWRKAMFKFLAENPLVGHFVAHNLKSMVYEMTNRWPSYSLVSRFSSCISFPSLS